MTGFHTKVRIGIASCFQDFPAYLLEIACLLMMAPFPPGNGLLRLHPGRETHFISWNRGAPRTLPGTEDTIGVPLMARERNVNSVLHMLKLGSDSQINRGSSIVVCLCFIRTYLDC